MKQFRKHHLTAILSTYDLKKGSLDLFLSNYFRHNRAIGSKDRKEILSHVYTYFRFKNHFPSSNWEENIDALLNDQRAHFSHPHHNVSFPKFLYERIAASHKEAVDNICKILNEQAPITLRTNISKISRDKLREKLSKKFEVSPTEMSPTGIRLKQRGQLFSSEEFKAGYFEMQDEASQLAAALIEAKPGDHVLDYCSGSGGKALAIAPHMEGKGQIYLHDIREKALYEAKKRLKRAGVQNGQFMFPQSKPLNRLKGNMDWVLVDAPCTGTGTYRRNPEQKWKFTQEMLEELIEKQKEIFKSALQYLTPKGTIVYATCSILDEENGDQVQLFCEQHNLEPVGEPLKIIPQSGGMDGFFAQKLRRKS